MKLGCHVYASLTVPVAVVFLLVVGACSKCWCWTPTNASPLVVHWRTLISTTLRGGPAQQPRWQCRRHRSRVTLERAPSVSASVSSALCPVARYPFSWCRVAMATAPCVRCGRVLLGSALYLERDVIYDSGVVFMAAEWLLSVP